MDSGWAEVWGPIAVGLRTERTKAGLDDPATFVACFDAGDELDHQLGDFLECLTDLTADDSHGYWWSFTAYIRQR